jgi:integrase
VRERYQHPSILDYGDKWLAYWDHEFHPRRKRGKVWSKRLVPSQRQAQRLADEFMVAVNERNSRAAVQRGHGDRFADLVKLYRGQIYPHHKNSTRLNYDFFLNSYLLPAFGTRKLVRIKRIEVQEFVNGLALAPKSVRNLHGCFRAILNEAIGWEMLKENPAVGVRLPRVIRKAKELLQPKQIRQLIEALPWPTKGVIVLMVHGSLRFGEVAGLRWQYVSDDRLEIRQRFYDGEFDDTKTQAGRRDVPLDAKMREVLEQLRETSRFRNPDDLVFTAANGSPINRRNLLRRHLKPTLKNLKLPSCSFHDFRHLHSSLSMRVGASPEVTRDNMGHSSVELTQNTYTGSWWEQRVAAVQGIAELIWSEG